ncbi:MAG: thioredoxin family protein [Trueperaceae bacterium]|nr:thioredoxin family protein [Trueperaceae bacterium]
MEIKVLGSGCSNCKSLEASVQKVLERFPDTQATITKVTEYPDILAYGVSSTPALVVDEKVVATGRVPSPRQLEQLLGLS